MCTMLELLLLLRGRTGVTVFIPPEEAPPPPPPPANLLSELTSAMVWYACVTQRDVI